ncbi:helix-turn-helix transcriptional regulator [Tepidiforma sp.]|uniref:helix-turn-helix transcriptional regulator n=1 Tax=Tepidiforma sp. TaxID=2682230 RepID=UPI002ADE0165|nr:helix-turn-helix transcriptional regulator [Tepidiforma sp.]
MGTKKRTERTNQTTPETATHANGSTNGAANGAGSEEEPIPRPRLHGELLSTSLLAFLRGWNAYGYELTQKLAAAGLPQSDSGTVYRTLRQLERAGLVSSFWDTSESGPARRMYSLTQAGEAFLAGWIDVLQNYQRILQRAAEGLRPYLGERERDDDGDDAGAGPKPADSRAGG